MACVVGDHKSWGPQGRGFSKARDLRSLYMVYIYLGRNGSSLNIVDTRATQYINNYITIFSLIF